MQSTLMRFLPLCLLPLCASSSSNKIKGVNYGDRFIPEDWMATSPYDFYSGLTKQAKRFSLADVVDTNDMTAKARMLNWLDATIKEQDFVEMNKLGVEVVRVPCGYWNWITYPSGTTPTAPTTDPEGFPVVEKLKNLQSIATPGDYSPYFDKIFQYAAENGIKVLLDLHGLPGSQNGEIHSGIVTGAGDHPTYYFESDWNMQQAVAVVDSMAEYGATKLNLFGIQVINEPQSLISHDFLSKYYKQAILKARAHLNSSVPIVLFEWTYNFGKWAADAFKEATYGTVYWDTHIYHMGGGNVSDMKKSNWGDYESVGSFVSKGHSVFVGEWTLAGMSGVADSDLQGFAAWFVQHLECAGSGTFFWNFDGPGTWGFSYNANNVAWADVFAERNSTFRSDGASFGIQTFHGGWMSASWPFGSISVSKSYSQWEEWTPYFYMVNGSLKVALQSWHGKWLSAAEDGTLSARAPSHSAWEEFTPYTYMASGGYKVALQSYHGKWISATDTGGIAATASSHSAWEELTPTYCDQPSSMVTAPFMDRALYF